MNDIEKIYQEFGKEICLFPFLAGFYQTHDVVDKSVDTVSNSIRPCSLIRWDGDNPWNLDGDKIQTSRNKPVWQQLRKDMLDGKFRDLKSCQTCSYIESLGGVSPRQNNNDFFVEFLDIDIADELRNIIANEYKSNRVLLLEYFPSNYCNYECVMCGEGPSSRRHTFENKHYNYGTKIILNSAESDFEDVLKDVQLLGFTGGETILQKQVHHIIDYLIEKDLAKNIVITLLTNLSDYPEKLMEKFSLFKKVLYTISIDGVGEVVEYQRRGCKWENVEQNAIRIHNTDYLHEIINYVVTSMNILNAMDFIDWCHDNDFRFFTISPVHRLEYLGPSSLPPELRTLALQKLNEGRKRYEHYSLDEEEGNYLRAIDQIIGNIEHNPFDPTCLQQFIERITIENKGSKKPLHEVVPEWKPYFIDSISIT